MPDWMPRQQWEALNLVPHLHCHLVPRYYGDPAPGTPIDPNAGRRLLSPEAYAERITKIRAAL